ncbi:hypothetical protein SteCoe_19502 [Stentor coeruleus]|uniref:EGF-like domain-containing protein n=1 Tax=Stentor coeruleus TaxID=5963 RepID=A0A1R2BUP4_9CILI|nr:hypothetical protein SteCoe_19502 [Stentor coeruleus]
MIAIMLITAVMSKKIVDYRFGYNFGQVFHDYSLSNNDAVNGDSTSTTTNDIISTDRGAYFSGINGQRITLPPNSQQSLGISLGSKFYICMWVCIEDSGNDYLTYRVKSDNSHYLFIYRQSLSDILKAEVKFSGCSSGTLLAKAGAFPASVWVFIVLSIDELSAYVYINDVKEITFTFTSTYSETGTFSHYIGYTDTSPVALFWNYLIYIDESYSTSVFTISTYTPGNCLVNTCPTSCTPGIIWNGNSYCISVSIISTSSGDGTSCSGCTGGCNSSGICFDCDYASSCDVSTGVVMEINSDGSLSTYTPCKDGEYLDISGDCQSCMSYCKTCDNGTSCASCISTNAYPNDSGECICKDGTYASDLTLISGCMSCDSECLTCYGSSSVCLTCTAIKATVDISGKCICNDGTYEDDLTISSGCIDCNLGCATCEKFNTGSNCLTCYSLDAMAVSDGNCYCHDGYYAKDLTQEIGCEVCNAQCATCTDRADNCRFCITGWAYPDDNGVCYCGVGLYTYDLTISDGCLPCMTQCLSCNNANTCIECTDPSALIDVNGLCYCPNDFNIDNGCLDCHDDCDTCSVPSLCLTCSDPNAFPSLISGCDCKIYYYKSLLNLCEPCHESCSLCIEADKCLACKSENAMLNSNQVCQCKDGYYDADYNLGYNCLPCDSSCSICNNENTCLECIENYALNSDFKCVKICNNGQFEYLGNCFDCQNLCLTCNSFSCLTCVNNSQIQGTNCTCLWGYSGEKECVKIFFTANINIDENNNVEIAFTEGLSDYLEEKDFNISFTDEYDFTYEFKENNLAFVFSIDKNAVIPDDVKIIVKIAKKNVRSVFGSFLDVYEFEGVLYSTSRIINVSQGVKNIANSTEVVMKVVVSSAIATGIMGSPSCIWILFNTAEVLSFLPLGSIHYTKRVKNFLISMGGINLLPNPFSVLFSINNNSEPYKKAKDYGLSTSYIVINGFSIFFQFLLQLVLISLLYIIKKIVPKDLSVNCHKLLKDFKFNYFIRFWTQSFLTLGILSFVQVKSKYEWNFEGIFNVCLASIIIIMVILSPIAILIGCCIVWINKPKEGEFKVKRKFSCHFKEFRKEKGFFGFQFYTFYFLRRLLYIFSQTSLNSTPGTQIVLNIVFSSFELLYLIVFLPYKDKYAMISAIIGEVCTLEIMSLSLLFLYDLSTKKLEVLESVIILSVFICMLLHSILSICAFLSNAKNIKSFILNIVENIRKTRKSTRKVECDNVTHTREIEISTSRTFVGNFDIKIE